MAADDKALVLDTGKFDWAVGTDDYNAPSQVFEGDGHDDRRKQFWSRLQAAGVAHDGRVLVSASVFDDLGTASVRELVRDAFLQLGAAGVSVYSREFLAVVACGITTALALNIDGDSTGRHCEISVLVVTGRVPDTRGLRE